MSTLFPKPLTAYRKAGAYDTNGVWQEAAAASIAFNGSIQPMTGAEISNLPVGRETDGKCKIFSDTRLQISQQEGDNAGDYIQWQGFTWELIWEQAYDNDLIPHSYYVGECRGPV